MLKRFRNFCRGKENCGCRKGRCRPDLTHLKEADGVVPDNVIQLSEVEEHKRIKVFSNSDIKTMEMGLYPGSVVSVVHNDRRERNIIVKIHDQRYVIPRTTASKIMISY